ncbi:hypothetical protein PoB_001679200 [Plakobranchus ocellatus]|uniref:Uncharacterized protein n=1 Tax=Plakobranchus ocellatus TaxID=259542 RepID=A0AAV3Z4W2_9GAST|nr:hypothetical protein PoB_001679200 [Plakobranchus ocellatus]
MQEKKGTVLTHRFVQGANRWTIGKAGKSANRLGAIAGKRIRNQREREEQQRCGWCDFTENDEQKMNQLGNVYFKSSSEEINEERQRDQTLTESRQTQKEQING